MTSIRTRLAGALGGRQRRQRRHRRFLLVAIALLVVATVFLVIGGDDGDGGFAEAAAPICDDFETRLRDEFELSFPEGVPTPEAQAVYLSHAFADTTQELVEALAALGPSGDGRDAVETMQALVDQLRVEPSAGIGTNPFSATVAPAFDAAGVTACGSGFLAE